MKIIHNGQTLSISEIPELSAANSSQFRESVGAALPPPPVMIELDLSQTRFMDGCGLGALFALGQTPGHGPGGVTVRLLNPTPPVQQLLELTQMHRLFEIARR